VSAPKRPRKTRPIVSRPSDERYTPESVLRVVREFSHISLDPCTTAANPVKADRFFTATEADPSLSREWRIPEGTIAFTNCPYSRGQISRWASKVFTEWGHWRTENVMLVPADPSTRWSQVLLSLAHAVAFWSRRIAFIRPDGTYDEGAKQPSAFYYFGERQGRFKRVFEPHATVITLR
jgi:hypothetical protein